MRLRPLLVQSLVLGAPFHLLGGQSPKPPAARPGGSTGITCYSGGTSDEDIWFWKGRTLRLARFTRTPEGERANSECPDELMIYKEGSAAGRGEIKGQPERSLSLRELQAVMNAAAPSVLLAAEAHGLTLPVRLERLELLGPFAGDRRFDLVGRPLILGGSIRGQRGCFAIFSFDDLSSVPLCTGFLRIPDRHQGDNVDVSPSGRYAITTPHTVRKGRCWALVEDLSTGQTRSIRWQLGTESAGHWRYSLGESTRTAWWVGNGDLVLMGTAPQFLLREGLRPGETEAPPVPGDTPVDPRPGKVSCVVPMYWSPRTKSWATR